MSSHASIPATVSLFTEAGEKFRSSLSEKQLRYFKEYPNAKSMLQALDAEVKNHPIQASILTKCCQKISSLSTQLEPFFKVIDLFVSSSPEFAAIAWGSIRLVFMLGTNHAEFLERVCELFEDMSMKLPAYEEYYEDINASLRHRGAQNPPRVFKAMAYIYTDLIQFCFDICQVFSRKRSKFLSLQGSFVRSLSTSLFNPFNVRFDTLLRRWAQHQDLMRLEIQLMAHKEQAEATRMMETMLDRFVTEGAFEESKRQYNEWSRDPERIKHRLRSWINPPPWLELFETAQNQRQPSSTLWFLEQKQVSHWLSEALGSQHPTLPLLSIQGKPGYGKTTLCTSLIEHLQKEVTVPGPDVSSSQKRALTFFFFDKQRPDSISSGAVWRAILAQLLHIMPSFDPDVFDIFLVCQEGRRSGQHIASGNEIFSVLNLLVQRLDRLFIVVDGVDECLDPEQFLHRLSTLIDGQFGNVAALFSRPTVTIPPKLMQRTIPWSLLSELNLQDIEMFLRPKIINLIEDGLLPSSHDAEEITTQVASRANGMFLWATLFINYLQSPYISVRERHDAIRGLNRLEGLDLLYGAVLKSLRRSTIGNARANIAHAFELVLHSFRPLHIGELQYALAVPMYRGIDEEDLIPNLAKNIGNFSGALMELDQNGFVRFVHLSVIEYLSDSKVRDPAQSSSADFAIDRHRSHQSLACRCLSYLRYSVKGRPLADSPYVAPSTDIQVKRYPLLDYTTEFWSFHVLECLEHMTSNPLDHDGKLMVELASKFLSNQSSIMVWIEASWMFGRPPQIRHGPSDAFFKRGMRVPLEIESQVKATWERAWLTLLQLSQDVAAINSSWSHVLKDEPNEIWEPSLSAFNQSQFWQRISGANIVAKFRAKSDDQHSVCLKSRLSPDGSRVAIIRLYASRADEMDVTVFFELWSIEPNVKIRDVNLNIAKSCMKPFLPKVWWDDFQFPIAITTDFHRVAAPGCVVHIPTPENEQQDYSMDDMTQYIDFVGNSWRNGPFEFGLEDFKLGYDIQISHTGAYLMTVHKSEGLVEVNHQVNSQLRLVNVYQDMASSTSTRPSYRHIASLAFKPAYSRSADWNADWCALLHPRYPIVAFKFQRIIVIRDFRGRPCVIEKVGPTASLWDFRSQGGNSLRYTTQPSERLHFDHDGEYFSGIPVNTNEPSGRLMHPREKQGRHEASNHVKEMALSNNTALLANLPYRPAGPFVQNLRELNSNIDESGVRSVSQLTSSGKGGLVLTTLRQDGHMTAEMVTRLPEAISTDYKAVLLNNSAEESLQHRKIFLDRSEQPFGTHALQQKDTTSAAQLPFVLNRQHETIPIAVGRGRYTLEGGVYTVEKPQKRIGRFEDEHEAKRRNKGGSQDKDD